MINTEYLNWIHRKRKRDEECQTKENSPVETIDGRLKGSTRMKLMVDTDSGSGKKRVGGRENKDNLVGESTNILKRKHRLKSLRKESKDLAQVGWILDYGLRLQGEKGWVGGKRKQLKIELGKDEEARVDLTRNAPDVKSRGTTNEKPTA